MMVCPISITKFVGTISLGLLTGVSYTISALALPPLSSLPTASQASSTLSRIQHATTLHTLTLASISSLSFLTAYSLAGPRGKHPYLLWTAIVSFLAGQGVEWYWNGFSRFPVWQRENGKGKEIGYVEVEKEGVNGEKVEAEMVREKRVQRIRTAVGGLGFAMGVVGIWGDGA